MKPYLICIISLIMVACALVSCDEDVTPQPVDVLSEKMFGGSGHEAVNAMQETPDGGFIVCGSSDSDDVEGVVNHGGRDYYILKLNVHLEIEWQKMYGGTGHDSCRSILQPAGGGYLVGGTTRSTDIIGGESPIARNWFLKLDDSGNVEWEQMADYTEGNLFATDDGGYVFLDSRQNTRPEDPNYGSYDIYLLKLDSQFHPQWEKTYGTPDTEHAVLVQQTDDGGFIIGGRHIVGNWEENADFYLVKIDALGNVAWEKIHGGPETDWLFALEQTNDGGYVAAGYTRIFRMSNGVPFSQDWDAYVVKMDDKGNVAWTKTTGGSKDDQIFSICQTPDGGFIATGESMSTDIVDAPNIGGMNDYYVLRVDAHGNIRWQQMYGGAKTRYDWHCTPKNSLCLYIRVDSYEYSNQVLNTSDGGFVVAGNSDSGDIWGVTNNGEKDYYIIKLGNERLP